MSTDSPVALAIPGLTPALRMLVHDRRDAHVSRRIREEGLWEPYETSLLIESLSPGDVFVDVGANIGYFSLIAAQLVGSRGRVFAFEPDPDNFRLLQANATLNGLTGHIHAECAALAEADGRAELYLSEDNLGDHQIFDAGDVRRTLPIVLRNGSDCLRGRLDRIDLLKVDTQGAEFRVMAGLMPLLREVAVTGRILVELTPLSLRQAGSSGRALLELLGLLGQPFWIVDHLEHRLVASDQQELARWCDEVDAVPGDAGFMNILVGPGLA